MKTTFLSLAVLVSAQAATAQTVVTPPRSITSQQETPGVDSTFQGDIQPNVQTSTIVLNTGAAAPAPTPSPAPPPAPLPPPAPPPPLAPLPINGNLYFASCTPMGSGGTWSCVAQLYIEFDPDGTYKAVRESNIRTTTVASGTWLPAGDSASHYVISATTAVTQDSNGTNGSVSFNNTIGAGKSMSSAQSIGVSASFFYRAPRLPANVNGGSGSETISFAITNTFTRATQIGTVKISVSAYPAGA